MPAMLLESAITLCSNLLTMMNGTSESAIASADDDVAGKCEGPGSTENGETCNFFDGGGSDSIDISSALRFLRVGWVDNSVVVDGTEPTGSVNDPSISMSSTVSWISLSTVDKRLDYLPSN